MRRVQDSVPHLEEFWRLGVDVSVGPTHGASLVYTEFQVSQGHSEALLKK